MADAARWLEAAEALEAAIGSAFGPQPREKLLVSAANKVTITSSGASVLAALVTDHPVARNVIDAALEHASACGDGASSVVLMVCAALRDALRQLAGLPEPRRTPWPISPR